MPKQFGRHREAPRPVWRGALSCGRLTRGDGRHEIDQQLKDALRSDRLIDITTTGRRSGEPRRIEIWFYNLDDRIFITGLPGPRGWYANLRAEPSFTLHLKESAQADLPARARLVTDEDERRELFAGLVQRMDRAVEIDEWTRRSPLVEVTFEDDSA